jgi:hypothetical protein
VRTLLALLCGSTLYLGLAVTGADAQTGTETRIFLFVIQCDGQQKTLNFTASGLGANTNKFAGAAEISIIDNPGALHFIIVDLNGDATKVLMTMGVGETHGFKPNFIPVTTNNSGAVVVSLLGACSTGGQTQGFLTVLFFPAP